MADMRTNLLPNPEYQRFRNKNIKTKNDVMSIIQEFLRNNVNGDGYFDDMFADIEKQRNHVIVLDDSNEEYKRHGAEGNRVAYGAFRHSAFIHSVQTVWSYTFEIIDEGDTLYIGVDTWGWLHDADLDENVSTLLE